MLKSRIVEVPMNHRKLSRIALLFLAGAFYIVITYGELYFIQQNKVNITSAALMTAILVDLCLKSKSNFLKSTFSFFAVFLSSIILIIAFCIVKKIIFEPVYFPSVPAQIELKDYEEIKSCGHKILSKDWNLLSKHEKVNLLQIIVNHEAAELKLKDSLSVEAAEIPMKGSDFVTNANYNRLFDKIIVRSSLLDMSGNMALKSTIHEVRHAYQNILARAYDENNTSWMSDDVINDAKMFSKSLYNKRENVQNYNQYYNELVERDAREYATERIKKYYQLIYRNGERIQEVIDF